MMGFNGGLLGVQRQPSSSFASGMWFPNEQALAVLSRNWPSTDAYRYYRLSNFANTILNADAIDFGEIELYFGDTKYTGLTCTTNFSFTSSTTGTASVLVDGITSISTRAYRVGWNTIRPTATITIDLGSIKRVTHIKIFTLYTPPRFPASFVLSGSNNNSDFITINTVTVGTNFTSLGSEVYSSDKVAI